MEERRIVEGRKSKERRDKERRDEEREDRTEGRICSRKRKERGDSGEREGWIDTVDEQMEEVKRGRSRQWMRRMEFKEKK